LTIQPCWLTVEYVLAQEDDLDQLFHALADGSRRQMLERLSTGPASVSELAAPLPMTLAAVVQHVQVLETAGLIRTTKVGRVRRCRLEVDTLRPVDQWIADRKEAWAAAFDRLGDVLAELEEHDRSTTTTTTTTTEDETR
jgi:DNA-binding transcriptional ArsR family regulator